MDRRSFISAFMAACASLAATRAIPLQGAPQKLTLVECEGNWRLIVNGFPKRWDESLEEIPMWQGGGEHHVTLNDRYHTDAEYELRLAVPAEWGSEEDSKFVIYDLGTKAIYDLPPEMAHELVPRASARFTPSDYVRNKEAPKIKSLLSEMSDSEMKELKATLAKRRADELEYYNQILKES